MHQMGCQSEFEENHTVALCGRLDLRDLSEVRECITINGHSLPELHALSLIQIEH